VDWQGRQLILHRSVSYGLPKSWSSSKMKTCSRENFCVSLTSWHGGSVLVQVNHEIFGVQNATRSLTTAIMEWLHAEGKVESSEIRLAVDQLQKVCAQGLAETMTLQKEIEGLAIRNLSSRTKAQLLWHWAEACRAIAEQLLNDGRLFERLADKYER
ncbi:MAG: hypothetical protein MUO92_00125, partial [Dehalococcoidales bacterium]|nr:hypothetical protein [Dehalococcoidales bacterium]